MFKIIPNLKKNIQNDFNSLSDITNDYHNTTEHEYRELLEKKKSLVEINGIVEKYIMVIF